MNEFCDVCSNLLITPDELTDKLCNGCLKTQLMESDDDSYKELDFNENDSYYVDVY